MNKMFAGGAVGVDLAARPEYGAQIWCLILENTFTSIPDMAYTLMHWSFIKYFPLWFFKNKVSIPLLLSLKIC